MLQLWWRRHWHGLNSVPCIGGWLECFLYQDCTLLAFGVMAYCYEHNIGSIHLYRTAVVILYRGRASTNFDEGNVTPPCPKSTPYLLKIRQHLLPCWHSLKIKKNSSIIIPLLYLCFSHFLLMSVVIIAKHPHHCHFHELQDRRRRLKRLRSTLLATSRVTWTPSDV